MTHRNVLALVLGIALGMSGTLVAEPATASEPYPGAPGIGDPYFPGYGNGGYDVKHYDIGVTYDVGTGHLVGDTTVTARAVQDLSRFNLDLELKPRHVWIDGTAASLRKRGREVTVTPAAPIAKGDRFKVRTTYAGVPGNLGDDYLGGWNVTPDGAFAAGAPEVATLWFPSNDHPADKATYDVRVTTDAGKDVLSNGTLVSKVSYGSGLTTTHWQARDPMATYLATVVIGDFRVRQGIGPNGTPYLVAVSTHLKPEVRRRAMAALMYTPRITRFFENRFGPYPFETVGGIVVDDRLGFALENQTRPIYGATYFKHKKTVSVVAHEVSHQWFGDSVSLRRWRDTWLNEGFATWATWRWQAHRGGRTLNDQLRFYVHLYTKYDGWGTPVQPAPRSDIFDGPVYGRGGMTLIALRNRIGPATLDRVMRTWARDHRYGHGTTRGFVHLAECVSGQHLKGLFDAWLHRPEAPARTRLNGFPRSMR